MKLLDYFPKDLQALKFGEASLTHSRFSPSSPMCCQAMRTTLFLKQKNKWKYSHPSYLVKIHTVPKIITYIKEEKKSAQEDINIMSHWARRTSVIRHGILQEMCLFSPNQRTRGLNIGTEFSKYRKSPLIKIQKGRHVIIRIRDWRWKDCFLEKSSWSWQEMAWDFYPHHHMSFI